MRLPILRILILVVMVALAGCSGPTGPAPSPTPSPEPAGGSLPATSGMPAGSGTAVAGTAGTASPAPPETPAAPSATATPLVPTEQAGPPADPFELLSQDSLFGFLEDLTAIEAYSGWRNSGSEGEAQALDYVAGTLEGFGFLEGLGLSLERQTFRVFLVTELWETSLHLVVDGQELEVPADGLRGPRDDLGQALRFDSDGAFNDSERDPVVAEGTAIPVRSAEELENLGDIQGKVVLLNYALIDRTVMSQQQAIEIAAGLIRRRPAGLVLVTQFSNQVGESHATFIGDGSALTWVQETPVPPTLYVRIEDLATAGIEGWQDLSKIQSARLTWDADVFAPGTSGNLVARVPGVDPSQAIILGAHIDSPNAPGALDDGSGSVILLEVARVLDAARLQPPVDLYLVWFGSEELGLYGSYHFVSTHQELLDRTLAMLQIDCLSRPLDGLDAELRLVTWPYGRLGDASMPWPDYLAGAAGEHGVEAAAEAAYVVYSDNSGFGGFDVPHADLIYEPLATTDATIHYLGHLHDPYDTVELVREVGDVLEEMARVALVAAVDAAAESDSLRVTPPRQRRAVFVASHTEAVHMSPTTFTELGMAFALGGFDVDLVPYGQAVTPADLEGAEVVVALPVIDYPAPQAGAEAYDEAWTEDEIVALQDYAASGGLLILTNSAQRLKYGNAGLDTNEDWGDANALASAFGFTYRDGLRQQAEARVEGTHPLVAEVTSLELGGRTAVAFDLPAGAQVLARAGDQPAMALLDVGQAGGQVLILADVGMLTSGWGQPRNLTFWRNLAQYAAAR
jgi:hypothetical protein